MQARSTSPEADIRTQISTVVVLQSLAANLRLPGLGGIFKLDLRKQKASTRSAIIRSPYHFNTS